MRHQMFSDIITLSTCTNYWYLFFTFEDHYNWLMKSSFMQGAQLDRMETDVDLEEVDSSSCSKDDIETEEFCALLRQQKFLNNLTEHALRKNNPVIIANFVYDKELSLLDHSINGTPKQEQMCLQALRMYTIPGGSYIELELSTDKMQEEDQEASPSTGKGAATPLPDLAAIPDTDLPIIVSSDFAWPLPATG